MTEMGRYVSLRKLSVDGTCEIVYSLRLCVVPILQGRTRFLCSRTSLKYSEEEPALQCQRQSARRTRHH